MSRRASILIFVGALVLIDALARWLTGSSPSLIETPTPPSATPAPPSSDDGLRLEFRPMLARTLADAKLLVELGESKERNLFRIRAGQAAMEQSLAAADAWLASNAVADTDRSLVMTYRDGAELIRNGMAEAQAGFLRLDFDRVAQAAAEVRAGERQLRHALAELDESS